MKACRTALIRIASYSYRMAPRVRPKLSTLRLQTSTLTVTAVI
jgi:hypothetical protein